jgi:hypothetical protein
MDEKAVAVSGYWLKPPINRNYLGRLLKIITANTNCFFFFFVGKKEEEEEEARMKPTHQPRGRIPDLSLA